MSVHITRRPAAALAVAALLSAGFAAPASASPWSDAWARLSGWFVNTPFGALWAEDDATPPTGDDGETGQSTRGGPSQVLGNEGGGVDPSGRPLQVQNGGTGADPSGAPQL